MDGEARRYLAVVETTAIRMDAPLPCRDTHSTLDGKESRVPARARSPRGDSLHVSKPVGPAVIKRYAW